MARTIKSKTYFKALNRVLTDSDLDIKVARLAVLYEDLQVEVRGIAARRLKYLDFTDEKYRRLYFIRRAVATLVEYGGALVRLDQCPEFAKIRERFSPRELQQWSEAKHFFDENKAVLANVRNHIGGHFQEKASAYALSNMHPQAVAKIEIVRAPRDNRVGIKLKFVGELAATALTAHKEEKTTEEFINLLVKLTREGFAHAVIVVHSVSNFYLIEKMT